MLRVALRKARKDQGLTQEQLAEKVGIHRVYYLQIEAGQRSPSSKVMFRIAEFLETDPRVLFADLLNTKG